MNWKLPPHFTLSINHNQHKSCYVPIKDYIFDGGFDRSKEMSQEEVDNCIEKDEIWEIQWYPYTPISFHYVCAPTLDECFEKIEKRICS